MSDNLKELKRVISDKYNEIDRLKAELEEARADMARLNQSIVDTCTERLGDIKQARQEATNKLEAELAEAYGKLAISIKERIDLGNELARYRTGVVVGGYANTITIELDDRLPNNSIFQRVKVLVMKEEISES